MFDILIKTKDVVVLKSEGNDKLTLADMYVKLGFA
jgi:hypothetical protein